MSFEVLDGGFLTTVQDAGRPGFAHLGVPFGGAVDTVSLAIANLLVGNDPAAAALELTVVGPELLVRAPVVIGVAGADLAGVALPGGRRLEPGRAYRLEPVTTISFPGPLDPRHGSRCYLAVPGGIDVPVVLGSRSTCLAAAFGGVAGRRLRRGDVVTAAATDPGAASELAWPAETPAVDGGTDGSDAASVRVLPGPLLDAARRQAFQELCDATWTVGPDSDRMGLRLGGPPLASDAGGFVSHGVTWGAIQVPPGGAPIVLLADHQPTGGYPVIAVAITADRPVLGQLAPGHLVRFQAVDVATARRALAAQRAGLDTGRAALGESQRWLDIVNWAGG